ncbi:hypothetical protein DEF24_25880, partial [Marinitenerispora sediminis]
MTDKDTVAWTTELTGPYAITETPEHIRLTVSYGGRSYTIEGDHATVQESFEAAYLDVVADPERPAVGPGGRNMSGAAGTGQQQTAPAPAPPPRLRNPHGNLDSSIQDWRNRAPRPDGTGLPPDATITPLTIQDHGANVLDAAYVAIARAHGWQHTGALDAAAI